VSRRHDAEDLADILHSIRLPLLPLDDNEGPKVPDFIDHFEQLGAVLETLGAGWWRAFTSQACSVMRGVLIRDMSTQASLPHCRHDALDAATTTLTR
jgi:hypothetical protein